MPDISLIISVYNRIDALALILKALNNQHFKSFEVIVAEDNNATLMKDFLTNQKKEYSFPIKHVSQPDNGFQKNKILNEAIKAVEGEYLVFIDGDCIPHPEFLNEYNKLLQPKVCLFGRRVMLSEAFTNQLLSTQNLQQLNFLKLLLSGSKRLEDGIYLPFNFSLKKRDKGIWGCNFGLLKQHMLDINGFDEDYTSANVGEDEDVEWRLRKTGVEFKRVKNKAIVYHLHHHTHYSTEDYKNNHALMVSKIKAGNYFCKNGIEKN